jgi:hypothetical protein
MRTECLPIIALCALTACVGQAPEEDNSEPSPTEPGGATNSSSSALTTHDPLRAGQSGTFAPPPPPPTVPAYCNGGAPLDYSPTGIVNSVNPAAIHGYMNQAAMNAGYTGTTGAFPVPASVWNAYGGVSLGDPTSPGYYKWYPHPQNASLTNEVLVFWNHTTQCAYWMSNSTTRPAAMNASKTSKKILDKYASVAGPDGFFHEHGPYGMPVSNPKLNYLLPSGSTATYQVFTNGVITHRSGVATAYAVGGLGVNVARASAGATATASSTYSAEYPASAVIDGDRSGAGMGSGGLWADGNAAYPDWVQVNFNGSKKITEIDVFSMQDSYFAPVAPSTYLTSSYRNASFQVQFCPEGVTCTSAVPGTGWEDVPGGNVTNNFNVWRRFVFNPVVASGIRVVITGGTGTSFLAEIEAWSGQNEQRSMAWSYMWDHVISGFKENTGIWPLRWEFAKPGMPLNHDMKVATCQSYAPNGSCSGAATGWRVSTVSNAEGYDDTYAVKVGSTTGQGLITRGEGVGRTTYGIDNLWKTTYGDSGFWGEPFNGPLGYPVGRESMQPDGTTFQRFERGTIYWPSQEIEVQEQCDAESVCSDFTPCSKICFSAGNVTSCGAAGQQCRMLAPGFGETYEQSTVTEATAPKISFREEMFGGRLSNAMLTKYLEYPKDITGADTVTLAPSSGQSVRFATVCSNWVTDWEPVVDENISDTSMIVVVRNPDGSFVTALYSDDRSKEAPFTTSVGDNGLGSFVSFNPAGQTYRYTVYVYSNRLNTARCSLHQSTTSASPDTLAPVALRNHIGGLMVRVGAAPAGDTFEVQTRPGVPVSASRSDLHTRMALFRFAVDGTAAPIPSGIVSASPEDHDAKLAVPSGTAHGQSGYNYLLVGKKSNTVGFGVSNSLVHADLVRGPMSSTLTQEVAATPVPDGALERYPATPIKLQPGRYTIAIEVEVAQPPGSTDNGNYPNPIGPVPDEHGVDQINDRGFTNTKDILEYGVKFGASSNTATWNLFAAPRRKLSRGAFGSAYVHRFYHDIDVPAEGWYAPEIRVKPFLGVKVHDRWFAQRNADSAQLRLAHANMLYNDNAYLNEYKNAADLMGPRGLPRLNPIENVYTLSDPVNRSRFQFNADVVTMTELGNNDGWPESEDSANAQRAALLSVAASNDDRPWTDVHGRNEDQLSIAGNGAVFANASVATASTIAPDYVPGSCYNGSNRYFSCWMNGDWEWGDDSAAIPASIKVVTAMSHPILVVSPHLRNSSSEFRVEQIHALSDQMVDLIEHRPGIAGATAATRRLIFMGDFNIRAHRGGEHYVILRELRERFGYALDVSIALTNSNDPDVATGMHDINDCFQPEDTWKALSAIFPRFNPSLSPGLCNAPGAMQLPWWARTWRGASAGNSAFPTRSWDVPGSVERNDVIILAGRGWEMDDPVRAYRVIQESNVPPNIFAPAPSGCAANCQSNGVSLWPGSGVNPNGLDYRPRFDVGGSGTAPGSAAMKTDHRPIGATLRIWAGSGAR